MAGRKKIFKEEVALGQAMEVFWKYGYEGASMQKLLKAMGLNKGSLYYSFGSKKELFIRVLELYSQQLLDYLEGELRFSEKPIESIQQIFHALITVDEQESINKGCLLVNSVSELSFINPSLKEMAAHKLRNVQELFIKHLNIAKQKGQIDPQTPTQQVGLHLVTLWSGVQVNRRLYPEQDGLVTMLDTNLQVLNAYKTDDK
ncbi:MAG: TetR/AcrR family transcriptional regulator [Cyclobacteriaceae bacterium]